MLDDLKVIHERDTQDALGIAERQWQQLELEYDFAVEQPPVNARNIVYAGMGGSALAALVSGVWPGYTVPFEICRNYDIPAYVSADTYFIASSYSGNTEETLSALAQAEVRGAQIAVIAGGGQLADIARAKQYPLVVLPPAGQPRYAVLYGLNALLTLLEKAGLAGNTGATHELRTASSFLKEAVLPWTATVPANDNTAKQIAREVVGKSAVIYAGPKLYPAAYKWKIGFNENAKHIAWVNQYPEFNHNEFMGWTKQPVDKPYTVIDLRSNLEHEQIRKRFVVSERLLSGLRPEPIVVEAQGATLLEQLLWTIALGDFVTIYTALLNGLNPAPVDLIEKFKQELNR